MQNDGSVVVQSSNLNIACVYKPGGGFTDDYVKRLRDNVGDYCDVAHRFFCITNKRFTDIETIPFKKNRIGYWNKLEVFRRGLFDGPVIYLDLDTLIVDDVTDIFTYNHEFTTGHNWKGEPGGYLASWFLAFDGREDYQYLFDSFDGNVEPYEQDWACWGDQGHVQKHLRRSWTPLHRLFPGCAASYKWVVKPQGKIPDGVKFVAFHGRPRPHQVNWTLPNGIHRDQ